MINTSFNELYKESDVHKSLIVYFPELDVTLDIENIVGSSLILTETLCSDNDLVFGSCESNIFELTIANVEIDLVGKLIVVTQIVDDVNEMPLGTFVVENVERQNDRRYRKITAYDRMKLLDVNASDWYNGLTFPMTLAAFRGGLLSYVGIEEELRELPNDSMSVEKTIEPSSLSGRQVMQSIEEINGAFGHINRYGKFAHIVLEPSYGLYPYDTLFPADDLFPVSENDTTYFEEGSESATVTTDMIESIRFEDFTVKAIDKLQIRQEEGDVGAIAGTGSNAYVIEGNFLVFGKDAEELNTIAINALGNMQKRLYVPYTSNNIGLPYVEVGDTAAYYLNNTLSGYVFNRKLTGTQALRDVFSADGNQERQQIFGLNTEIIQLLGKSNVLKRTVDQLSVTITDLGAGLQSEIDLTASQIRAEVNDSVNNLQGQITVQAGEIALKVDSAGVIAAINVSPGTVKIEAAKIDLVSNAVSIVGKLYLNLNDNDTAVYAVSSGGTSNVVSYKVAPNPYGGTTFQAVVFGDMSEKTVVNGDTVGITAKSVSLNAGSGGNVQLSSTRSSSSNLFYSVNWDGQYFYPNTSDCYVGGPSFYWNGLYARGFYHYSTGTLGFFGSSQHSKTSVSTMSTSGTLADAISKINEIRNALNGYGLI
jgi:hypothetical protein